VLAEDVVAFLGDGEGARPDDVEVVLLVAPGAVAVVVGEVEFGGCRAGPAEEAVGRVNEVVAVAEEGTRCPVAAADVVCAEEAGDVLVVLAPFEKPVIGRD